MIGVYHERKREGYVEDDVEKMHLIKSALTERLGCFCSQMGTL
jgi:hypothetical protein